MPRKQKKYHFIYKTTNLLNEKFYVGMHSTDNLEDGYVGSGKRLGYSIRKYGLENHKFEILEFLSSREELKKREAEVVNEEMLKHPLCMNLKFGGEGGWDHLKNDPNMKIVRANNLNRSKARFLENPTEEYLEIQREKMKKINSEKTRFDNFAGKKHSKESIEKMKSSHKGLQVGSNNSQFGTCWICNDDEAKKIKKEDLQSWIDKGWSKGRKMPV